MITVKKLDQNKTIKDVKINEKYSALIKNNRVYLNNNVSAELKDKNINKNRIAIKVKKITLPNSFEYEILDKDFEIEKKTFDNITKKDIGKKTKFVAKVIEIYQTGGPTVFTLFDGTKAFRCVAFTKAGERSYPEINEEDVVEVLLEIKERDNTLEAEIHSLNKVNETKAQTVKERISKILLEKSKPQDKQWLIESKRLDSMKSRFIDMAAYIRKAIFEHRPIIIKHHADCDGYSAAIALERAILPLIISEHDSEKAAWQYYKRTPSKAPFYEYLDATKDISFFTADTDKFGVKSPLIILADNGSTEEDLLSIKKVKIYGAKVVVVDHHSPGKVVDGTVAVDKYVDCHINPHLFGYDSNITAGMLCTELSRLIYDDVTNINFLPALAGIADKSKCEEFDKYLQLSKMSKEFLEKLSACVDFEAHYLRFTEGRGLVNVLFGENRNKQKRLVELLYKDINDRFEKQKLAIKRYSNLNDENKITVLRLNLEEITIRGEFPAAGRTAGIGHEMFKKQGKGMITLGFGSNFVVFRCDEVPGFDVNEIVAKLKEQAPHTLSDGGGHAFAGSIKFLSAAKEEVLNVIDEYVQQFF